MATIARLDSKGITVIAEANRKLGDSPLVDSSTGPPMEQLLNGSNSNTSDPPPGENCHIEPISRFVGVLYRLNKWACSHINFSILFCLVFVRI